MSKYLLFKKVDNNTNDMNTVEQNNDEKIEFCCVCKMDTEYYVSTNIENRMHYIVGVGQLCQNCWEKLYAIKKESWIESEDYILSK